jgi:hypothetical protein
MISSFDNNNPLKPSADCVPALTVSKAACCTLASVSGNQLIFVTVKCCVIFDARGELLNVTRMATDWPQLARERAVVNTAMNLRVWRYGVGWSD